MPVPRGKRDKLFHEWTQHSGLPEDAVPDLEAEVEPAPRTSRMPLPLGGLNLGGLTESPWVLILLVVNILFGLVNLILISITLHTLTKFLIPLLSQLLK